jgi:hypothetical protein
MANNAKTYVGTSTDIKPYIYVNTGDFFYESDTEVMYQWNGSFWIQYIVLQDLITGGTYSNITNKITFTKYNGRHIYVSGITAGGGGGIFTGGTVTGPTTFLTGVTFNSYINFNGISYTYAFSGACAVGTATTISINTTTLPHRSIHIKYVLDDGGTNMRAGNFIMISNAVNSGSSVEYIDTSTNDIGNTSSIRIIGVNNGSGTNQIKVINSSVSSINIYFEYTLI